MKKITILFILVIILAGCSIETPKGSLPIVLPRSLSSLESRSSRDVNTEYDYARIYLKTDLKTETGFYNIDDSTKEVYKDVSYAEGSYTITGLNPGRIYDIYILFGFKDNNGILHNTTYYGFSEEVKIIAGMNNQVEVTVDETEVIWAENEKYEAKDIKQLVNIDGVINAYSGTGKILIDGKIINPDLDNISSIGKGKNIDGSDVLWINTIKGIYPYDDGNIDSDFSVEIKETNLSIDESAGIEFTKNSGETMILAYYQGVGTIGGTQIEEGKPSSEYEWFGKDDLIENMPDMEEMVSEVDKIIYDFVSFGKYAYVATALPFAPFLVTGNVLDDYEDLEIPEGSDVPTFEQLKSIVTFLEVEDSDGEQVTIKNLTAIKDSKLYLGSDDGIYVSEINSDGSIKSQDGIIDRLVTGTNNKEILKLEANGTYIGAITNDGVLIIKGNSVVKEFKSFMGLPESISDIVWVGSTLYISGSSGVVTYDASKL